MAELHIQWSDGRSEIRSLLPGQTVTVGNSSDPLIAETLPIGGTLTIGRRRIPFCQVRLHGTECPLMMLFKQESHELLLPSARALRKRWWK
jgi:hypothetical protein